MDPYLEETTELFTTFEESCRCKDMPVESIERMHQNEDLLRPALRLQYLQTRLMLSIAQSLDALASTQG